MGFGGLVYFGSGMQKSPGWGSCTVGRPGGPVNLFDDFGDDTCTDGAAAFADSEAQTLLHSDRCK